jgi:hypothetical protein
MSLFRIGPERVKSMEMFHFTSDLNTVQCVEVLLCNPDFTFLHWLFKINVKSKKWKFIAIKMKYTKLILFYNKSMSCAVK